MDSYFKKDNEKALINVDIFNKRQQIEGFGVSGAWWAQIIGGWDEEKRNKIINLLFNRENGIGLSIYRYNIGGGASNEISDPWRRTESFYVDKGLYDWNRDKNAIGILKEIYRLGGIKIVAFANSPPAEMTISGSAAGHPTGKSNIERAKYYEFCKYLLDVVNYFKQNEGITVEWISPVNEPQWDWRIGKGQEGCHYNIDECVELTKVLLELIEKEKADIKVSVIESADWNNARNYFDELIKEEKIQNGIEHFSIHSYWSELKPKKEFSDYIRNHYPNIKLWMSEWTEMLEGTDYGMESALNLANVVINDFSVANVTTWQYWIAVSKYDFRDGLIYVDETTMSFKATKRLWALGNFSKFIRNGFSRIEACSSNEKINVSAFLSDYADEIVVVASNNSHNQVKIHLNFPESIMYGEMQIYETSEKRNLEKIYSADVIKQICLTPISVTTLIIKKECGFIN